MRIYGLVELYLALLSVIHYKYLIHHPGYQVCGEKYLNDVRYSECGCYRATLYSINLNESQAGDCNSLAAVLTLDTLLSLAHDSHKYVRVPATIGQWTDWCQDVAASCQLYDH